MSEVATGRADPSLIEAREVAAGLGTGIGTGLSAAEAARRLEEYGPNELRTAPPVPLWRRVIAQFQDPLVYLLFVAIAISLAAWLVEGRQGFPVDVVVIAAIVLANAAIGLVQERQAENAVAALSAMTAANSTVVRDGALVTLPSSRLVVGDLLALAEGDSVGADARLLSASALRIQESALTGESEAVEKDPDVLAEEVTLGDRTNMVFKGTAVVQGVGRAVVTSTGMDTEMGAIAALLEATEDEPTPLQREISRVSRALGAVVIAIAVTTMGVLALTNGVHDTEDLVTVLLLGVSLAVAAVPEGLPAILSLVLALGVRAMARRNAVVKKLHSVETLGSATVICSDKTGTLTRNEMTLTRVVTLSGGVELTGSGTSPQGEISLLDGAGGDRAEIALEEARRVVVGGSLANNAQIQEEEGVLRLQGDPTEAAFLVAARKFAGVEPRIGAYQRDAEIPFDSTRKMMSTVQSHEELPTHRLFTKGAPDVLLEHCTHVQRGDQVVPLDDVARLRLLGDVQRLSEEAFRTLGVAWREMEEYGHGDEVDVSAEENLVYCGVVGIIDPPREEAARAVAQAARARVRVIMITGDHPLTATRIATDLGIAPPGSTAVSGAEIDRMDEAAFRSAVRGTNVFARVAPEHKLRIVNALQADGEVVAMTGDGVNDAPALKSADIGVAMGVTGTEVTKEAARMILGDDNFATIVAAIEQGRIIFDNIRKFLRYLLSSNMGEVATVFFGVLLADVIGLSEAHGSGIVLPLLATQILWINLVTDSAPALAMGVDPAIDDVMARPPRRPGDAVIDGAMWRRIMAVGLVTGTVSLFALDLFLPGGLVEGNSSLEVARTAAFTTIVFAQLFNALNSRSDLSSAFHRLFANGWLWAALIFGALAQVAVVHLPALQHAFGTVALSPSQWAVTVGLASVVLWFEELSKLVRRGLRRR